MEDREGVQIRTRERAVLTTLRRIIPGDFTAIREISDPTLSDLGFDFENSRLHVKPLKQPFLSLFLEETISEKTEVLAGIIRAKGDWTFVYEVLPSSAASNLWVATVMDFPDRFIKTLASAVAAPGIFIRPLPSGWLVAVQATFLKHIIKNANRRDSKF